MKIINPSKVDSRIVIEEEVFEIKAGDSLEVSDSAGEILLNTHQFLAEEEVTKKVESKEVKKEVKKEKEEESN